MFASCIDEPFISKCDDTTISIKVNPNGDSGTRTFLDPDLKEKEGEYPDNIVRNLRILTFDNGSGLLLSNDSYDIVNSALDVIQHPVRTGNQDFVFLANMPDGFNLPVINQFSDLTSIIYPASAFTSDKLIPMMQVIKGVIISTTGKVGLSLGTLKDINGNERQEDITQGLYGENAKTDLLILRLDRLAARVEIVLKSTINLEGLFTGITLSNIPDFVPLFASAYSNTITRDTKRSFTLDNDARHFSDALTPEILAEGYVWAKKITRIILPSNNLNMRDFTDATDKTNAIVLTANVENKYNASAPLSIIGDADTPYNYTIPYNTYLDIDGIVNEPLELNIAASPWEPVKENWQIAGIRMLNVSHTEVSITDFNGARISFWSNMPSVRVLPQVYLVSGGIETEDVTNLVFNDLAMTTYNKNQPSRFYYDPSTGAGYMDILADSLNTVGGDWNYKLYLVAEEADGTNQLKREIKVNVKQYGTRFRFDHFGISGYVGAFFQDHETGERIITGQGPTKNIIAEWSAIAEDDWIVLSSTPSFDPDAGTNDPGNPEQYPVRPNATKYKPDGRNYVTGRGRIYFRVGVTEDNNSGANRYGRIKLYYGNIDPDGNPYETDTDLYVRQGDRPDTIFSDTGRATIRIGSVQSNTIPRTAARKFSVYNLTAANLEESKSTGYVQLDVRTDAGGGGVFVKYPTQAGAFFQWSGGEGDNTSRRAYYPIPPLNAENFQSTSPAFWNTLKANNETCPPGYSRPNDGSEMAEVSSGLYYNDNTEKYDITDPQLLKNSTFRMSLFQEPEAGDGYRNPAGPVKPGTTTTYPSYPGSQYVSPESTYDPAIKGGGPIGHTEGRPGSSGGFYADGFFDRRPIDGTLRAVSTNNADIAFTGVLFFNANAKNSLFFPATGRITGSGEFQSQGVAGYYWSSSAGPTRASNPSPAWCFELAYYYVSPVTAIKSFGSAIRCVQGSSTGN